MIKPAEYTHPEDAAALMTLQKIPGISMIMKKVLEWGYEKFFYGINVASKIKLSPIQLPHIYRHLPPICEKLGIDEPEFYLEMNPYPNACTFGDTQIFISVTSGLIENMTDDELDAVLAHECGHIACRHVLYNSVADAILREGMRFDAISEISDTIQLAMFYWKRKSELSCDRAASLITSPETVSRVMARLAGGPYSLTKNINFKAWAEQADLYDEIYNKDILNNTLQLMAVSSLDHPFAAVRVREILKWSQTDDYRRLKNRMDTAYWSKRCRHCGVKIDNSWKYCESCGNKI